MKTATLVRVKGENQTLGVIHCETFVAKTLELKWDNNSIGTSCIPKGEYTCKYTRSERLSKVKGKDFFTYEILDVENRAGIRIHSANHFHQLRGCIALGDPDKELDIDGDGNMDIVHSGATIEAFEKFMNYEPFKLLIK